MLFIEHLSGALGGERHVDGTDGFVRVLRPLLGGVMIGLCGAVLLAEALLDIGKRRRLRLVGNARRVGTDIGDKGDMPLPFDVHALVEVLRHEHGLGRGVAELVGSILLQGARREGRGGVRARHALLDGRDGVFARRKRLKDGVRLLLAAHFELFIVELFERRLEGGEFLLFILQFCGDRPVFFGFERLDLALAVDDEPERHRLHAPRRKPALQFVVEKRRELIAHEAVKDAARLLRVHEVIVDLPRVLQRLRDGFGRNFVEFDAVLSVPVQPQHRLQVPGDRLALAVGVGRKIDAVGLLRLVHEAFYGIFLARRNDVARLEVLFDGNAQRLLREIADVSAGRIHAVLPLEIFGNGLRLGRRLYDDEIHKSSLKPRAQCARE